MAKEGSRPTTKTTVVVSYLRCTLGESIANGSTARSLDNMFSRYFRARAFRSTTQTGILLLRDKGIYLLIIIETEASYTLRLIQHNQVNTVIFPQGISRQRKKLRLSSSA